MATLAIERDRSPLAVLLDPHKDIPLSERDIRVEDWLNDKMQTGIDLDAQSLEALLQSVESQKQQLEEQLKSAKAQLDEAKNASKIRATSILELNSQFKEQQTNVNNRLMIVTSSDTPDEAARRLKAPLEKLRRLELAVAYVDMLNEVEMLVNEACGHLPENPKEALKPYTRLKQLAISLQRLQEPAEGAATHLVAYVQEAASQLWQDMKRILVVEFEEKLKQTNWPETEVQPTREWSDSFEKLLDLQAPEIMTAREPIILFPMSVLVKPFVQQFRYHFFSNVPTNHPHKLGEYFFQWFKGTLEKWQDFLRDNLGPILAAHFRGNAFAGNSLYVDPLTAFITAMLPVLQEKVDSLVVDISDEPQYLSQFINQLLDFDYDLREKYEYDAGNPEFGWKGLAWQVLATWFDRWLEVEKSFAMDRYRDIVKEANSPIDYDSASPGKTKTTFEAIKVTELISSVTDQYSKLRKFSYKTKFLISIQAEILDQYLDRLKSALDFYQSANTTVGRTLHGVTKEELAKLEGMGGLETLCRVFGSADHFISKLREWTNEEFFVELWDQMQDRAKATATEDKLAGDMTYSEVKECTSDALGSQDEGSVFDVTIRDFERQKDRAEELLAQAVKYSFPTTFRQYISKPQWTAIEEASSPDLPHIITAELDQPLQTLKKYLDFLRRALAEPVFRRIVRESLRSLEHMLYHDILLKQDFSTLGATRFMHDARAIQSVVDSVTISGSLGMPKLRDAVVLLNLPIQADDRMPLKEACRDLDYGNSDAASSFLAHWGITRLNQYEAKAVVVRRVEASYEA